MGARPADPRRIKLHRSYSIAEAADTLGVHKHTVENWLRQGLRPIDRRRPVLIHGAELRLFLQKRRRGRKSPCRPDEFYCLKCRTPRRPHGGLVDYLPKTPSTANLRGLCPECGSLMHRCITKAQLTSFAEHFVNACAAAGKIMIMQAANTGLTGGSTPDGDQYDRDIVIINTLRMAKIHLINEGRQVVCLPGATLYELEELLHPLGRNPHSVIGSSCIGASVFGGICNNSGGSLIHRGPAFTQMSLYAQTDDAGKVHLVNHLGIRLGNDPETILKNVESGSFGPEDIEHDPSRHCSDGDYQTHVRDIEAGTPARFNADPRRLFEASGSAGKLMLFAVRINTFPKEKKTGDFYIGTNDAGELTAIRRHMLANFKALPVQGEYIHRDAFAVAEKYGKDLFLAINYLGTERMPMLSALKGRFDAFCEHYTFIPHDLSDRIMQAIGSLFPRHLPKRLYDYHQKFEHHLLLRMDEGGIDEARAYLETIFPSAHGSFFECTPEEGRKAFLHRFVVASAAVRYRAIHRKDVEDIAALDIALPRNCTDWFERLPESLTSKLITRLYYGHFFCQVFHQDYIVKKGHDVMDVEHAIWELLDRRGAEYPAEHNVGHLYFAKPALLKHYKNLDPSNCFNPGIGRTSKRAHWH